MQLVFLGTGGFHPNERRHTASVMLPEVGVVFDAGTSFFRMPNHLKTRDLQVFLSHGHLDHICGLTFPIVPILSKELDSIRVYGSRRTLDAVRQHLFSDEMFPVEVPGMTFIELTEPIKVPNEGRLSFCELEHPGGSNGFRIDWPDHSMAYITDTIAPGKYVDFIRGVDFLIHECYFPDELADWALKTGHSHTTPVVELAKEAGVGRLGLVHIDPQRADDDPIDLQKARSIFPETFIAEDKMTIEIGE
ncbi:MAG: MBL fold metallo-hydrolase [Planctomycetaceae bacterium]